MNIVSALFGIYHFIINLIEMIC